jgi:hypothetical protein
VSTAGARIPPVASLARPTLQAPAPAPPPVAAQVSPAPGRVLQRVVPPDLTGRYEHVPAPGMNSAAVLHLNQAGHALVGWFSGPPLFVSQRSPTRSRAPEWNATWLLPGVLVARLGTAADWQAGAPCYWVQSRASAPTSGIDLMVLDGLDPPDALTDDAHTGYLRAAGPAVGVLGQEVQLMFEWAGRSKDDAGSYDRFLRVSGEARIPNFVIQQMPPGMTAAMYADQVRPIPSSATDARRDAMAGVGERVPPLAGLITAWHEADADNTALRTIRREAIGNYVRDVLDPTIPSYYRSSAFDTVRAQMAWKDLRVGALTQSYLQWLRQVAGEELARVRDVQAAHPGTAPKESDSPLLVTFQRAGLMPVGDFLYTFNFSGQSADVNKLREKAVASGKTDFSTPGRQPRLPGPVPRTTLLPSGGLRNPLEIVKLKGGVFKLDIKQEKVVLGKNPDGTILLKDGAPVVTSRSTVWNTGVGGPAGSLGNGYIGVFGDVGAGLSFEGFSGKGSASSGLSTISLHSPLDLRPEDFAWARLSAVLLAGPKVKLGDFVSLNVWSSRLVQVTLSQDSGGYTLDAVETTAMSAKTTELGDLKPDFGTDVRKVAENYDKKWTKPQVEARIFELSTSRAIVMPLFDSAPRPRTTEPLPRPKPVTDSKFGSWFVEGFFALDSADLDVAGPSGALGQGTARDTLEVHLATYRALFTSADVGLEITGMTSPEQPVPDNLVLSQNRARSVSQALADAFGAALRAKVTAVTGVGESYAVNAGMLDPEATGLTRAQFLAAHPDQVAQWPAWRRTDILVDGSVIVRVQGPSGP